MSRLENLLASVDAWLGPLGLSDDRPGRLPVLRTEHAVVVPSCFEHEDTLWVRLTAIVLVDVDPTLPLLYRVLAMNNSSLLGAFRLFEDRCLVYSATLPGSCLDADTFHKALRHVAAVADLAAPELRQVAGGRAITHLLREGTPCGSPS